MNTMTAWLEQYFDEVTPIEFYREIFPVGELDTKGSFTDHKYVAIAVSVSKEKKDDGSPKVRRYSVTDDLETIEQLCKTDDFCLMSPVSYAGRNRTAENARFLYAFAVDLDRVRVKGEDPVGLRVLWNIHILKADRIPKPTFIVSSGTGLHLYYVLTEPVAMFKDTSRKLQSLKRDLTSLIWHDAIVDIKSVQDIQQEGIYQGFRVPGTITKVGDRARAFLTGDKVTIEDLLRYTEGFRWSRERLEASQFIKKKALTKEKAKELYPDWYERRIEKGEPRGAWHVSRNVYEWWKRKILEGASVGHRYYCIMLLAMYARKCSMYDEKHNPDPVTREELERDAFELLDHMESLTDNENNHFTTGDIMDALEAFDDKWITYPRNSVDYRSGIRIEANKRNGRKQEVHLMGARAIQSINDKVNGTNWRDGNGRKSKKEIVQSWKSEHPGGTVADAVKDLKIGRATVYRHWNT